MRPFRLAVSLVVATSFAPLAMSGQEPTSVAQSRAHADSLLTAVQQATGAAGIAATVVRGGETLWFGTAGHADVAAHRPITPETRFRVGSVSKLFAVAVLARLVDRGVVDLDAPIVRYLPDFPNADRITARQLAGHLSGIRNYQGKDFAITGIDRRPFPTTASALEIFREDSLLAEPGARYQYSVYGYTLLTAVLEAASGKRYLELVAEEVTGPLGLTRSGPDRQDAPAPDQTAYYDPVRGDRPKLAAGHDPSYKWAAGGMLSTVGDLARLGLAHVRPGYLSAATLATTFTPQRTTAGDSLIVGLGWRISSDAVGRRLHHHAGSIVGGRAVLMVYPELDVAIAITSNTSVTPPMIEATAQAIVEPFLRLAEGEVGFARLPLSGRYAVVLEVAGDSSVGTLTVDERGATMTAPPVFVTDTTAGAVPPRLQVLPVVRWRGGALLPVVTAAGAYGVLDDDPGPAIAGPTLALFASALDGRFRADPVPR